MFIPPLPPTERPAPSKTHYYGDVVRRLFMTAGIIMLITLPFIAKNLPVALYISIFVIIFLGFFAGQTNPKQRWVAMLNSAISILALVVFEYYAVTAYLASAFTSVLFWVNQLLALIFFVALYYSSKTLRGMYVKDES